MSFESQKGRVLVVVDARNTTTVLPVLRCLTNREDRPSEIRIISRGHVSVPRVVSDNVRVSVISSLGACSAVIDDDDWVVFASPAVRYRQSYFAKLETVERSSQVAIASFEAVFAHEAMPEPWIAQSTGLLEDVWAGVPWTFQAMAFAGRAARAALDGGGLDSARFPPWLVAMDPRRCGVVDAWATIVSADRNAFTEERIEALKVVSTPPSLRGGPLERFLARGNVQRPHVAATGGRFVIEDRAGVGWEWSSGERVKLSPTALELLRRMRTIHLSASLWEWRRRALAALGWNRSAFSTVSAALLELVHKGCVVEYRNS